MTAVWSAAVIVPGQWIFVDTASSYPDVIGRRASASAQPMTAADQTTALPDPARPGRHRK